MNINFSAVVDYVKNLFPSKSAPVEPSDNPKMDACVLACLATGNVFYTRAMDGRTYLYYFTSFDEDVELAKYIMRSNGLKPREHETRYFFDKTIVLRIPRSELKVGMPGRDFVDDVLINANVRFDRAAVDMRINQIKQKMNQNVK